MPFINPGTGQTSTGQQVAPPPSRHMFGWLTFPVTHGYITSYQGPGTDTPHYANDIGTPYHTPITALWSGQVTAANQHLGWGTELFITSDWGMQYYYYHMDTLAVTTGQHVNQGDLVGYSGGQNQGGSNPSATQFSSGPHTHVGFFERYIATQNGTIPFGPDITPYLQQLAKGQDPISGASTLVGSSGSFTPLPGTIANAPNPFAGNDDVAKVFWAIDQFIIIPNPLPPWPDDINVLNAPVKIFEVIFEFVFNLFVDIQSLIIRFFITALGVYIIFKVANHLINITGTVGKAIEGAAGVVGGVAAFL